MYHLLGEYECSIDAKGRVRLPSTLLRQFGGNGSLSFVINRGFEKCLMLYPQDVWDKKTAEVNQLNLYNTKQRNFMRYFYRGASPVALDSADRLLLPKTLQVYAGIDKEVILFAYNEQIEIWSKSYYDSMIGQEPEEFAALAEEVFGSGKSDQVDHG